MLCGRAFFGGLFMFVAAVVEWRRGVLGPHFGLGPLAPPIVALSAVAMTSYIAALKTTTVAEVMVIYATLPFVAAGLAFAVNGERTSARTLIAAGVALARRPGHGRERFGDRPAGRAGHIPPDDRGLRPDDRPAAPPSGDVDDVDQRDGRLCGGRGRLRLFAATPAVTPYDLCVLAAFGLTTMCIAFFLFMEGAKHIPPAEAGLISMLDVVLGPLWVFLAFGEKPGPMAIVGGTLVIGALVWRLRRKSEAAEMGLPASKQAPRSALEHSAFESTELTRQAPSRPATTSH